MSTMMHTATLPLLLWFGIAGCSKRIEKEEFDSRCVNPSECTAVFLGDACCPNELEAINVEELDVMEERFSEMECVSSIDEIECSSLAALRQPTCAGGTCVIPDGAAACDPLSLPCVGDDGEP